MKVNDRFVDFREAIFSLKIKTIDSFECIINFLFVVILPDSKHFGEFLNVRHDCSKSGLVITKTNGWNNNFGFN
jgi:hypothetical protein